jgi:hypothetical protein
LRRRRHRDIQDWFYNERLVKQAFPIINKTASFLAVANEEEF